MRQQLLMIIFGLSLGGQFPTVMAEPLNMEELLPKEEAAAPADDATTADSPPNNETMTTQPTVAAPAAIPAPAAEAKPETVPATVPTTSGDVLSMPTPPKSVSLTLPGRGMKTTEVETKFGAPIEKVEAIGKPPIARWVYSEFTVYFEGDTVLHAVLKDP